MGTQSPAIAFHKAVVLNDIVGLRNRYLDYLAESQELYLELMVRRSSVFIVRDSGRCVGYFILGNDSVLLEYYITPEHIHTAETVLGLIIRQFSIRSALCKSFDHMLLSCCSGFQKKMNVIGIMFREFMGDANAPLPEMLSVRPAGMADETLIIDMNEDVFDHDHEAAEYIDKKQVLIFEKDHRTAGFGIFARVIQGRPDFDIGMCVHRDERRKGFGTLIVRTLVQFCRQNGWRATCGCAIDNIGSRKCLEKAGFVAGYRLLEFGF
ncbi:GNAT family N-acetyltransferase [bacterium]|nr:GNAT family N-acetyltransferase [bacterium]